MNVTELLDAKDIVWHQKYEIEPGVFSPGASDIGWLLHVSGLPPDLTGKSVLDIGTTNGFGAFEAERRGADHVVATDILEPSHFGINRMREYLTTRCPTRKLREGAPKYNNVAYEMSLKCQVDMYE